MSRPGVTLSFLIGTAVIGVLMWAIRSPHAHSVPSAAPLNVSRIIIPAGSLLTIKIAENVLRDARAEETFEALTTEPVVAEKQLAVPVNTRATLHIDRAEKNGTEVNLTVQVPELIFSDRNVAIHTVPLVTNVIPMSAFNLMMRSAGGMLGAAVGAADRAAIERDPLGAGALEGLGSGSRSAVDAFVTLRFQIDQSVDITGIRW